MKKQLLALLTAISVLGLAAGCFSTADGHMKAGVPFMKDTIESRYERPVPQILEAAKEELQFIGTLSGENRISNSIEAKVDTRTVWVVVDEVQPKISRVRVQARTKGGLPDIYLASEIDKRIALRLK